MKRTLTCILGLTLAGCATNPEPYVGAVMSPPAREALYAPEKAQPGRLEYAPDRDTFAPVLTERFTFPTQQQANNAWLRARVPPGPQGIINASEALSTPESSGTNVSRISIFACKPGAFDEQTTRIARYKGPVVHCATDFLNEAGQRLRRETVNFYWDRRVWRLQETDPPRTPVRWRDRETSPGDHWSWLPFGNRYE